MVAAHPQPPLTQANISRPLGDPNRLQIVHETLTNLERAINAYKKLVGHYLMMLSIVSRVEAGQVLTKDGLMELRRLGLEKPSLESNAMELLRYANIGILTFNKDPLAQVPKFNQMVSSQRISLEQIYMRAHNEGQKVRNTLTSFLKSPNIARYSTSLAQLAMAAPAVGTSQVSEQQPATHPFTTAQFITAEASSTTDFV